MEFTHFDAEGNAVMVDVGGKKETEREAVACGTIHMSRECFFSGHGVCHGYRRYHGREKDFRAHSSVSSAAADQRED